MTMPWPQKLRIAIKAKNG